MKTVIIGVFLREKASVSDYFLEMANEFSERGYKVILITDEHRKDLVDTVNNPMILTWPSYHPKKWVDFIFLKNLLQKNQVEIMISNFTAVNLFLLVGAIFRVPNRISWLHTLSGQMTNVPKWKFFRKRLIYKLATHIIANSEATKKDAIKTFKIHEKKILVVPNLIKNNDKYLNTEKEFKIVYVGRFHKTKGIDVLIKALSIIKDEFPNIKLELIGRQTTKYVDLVSKYGLERNIKFLGSQPKSKVLEYLSTAEFSIVPSLAEAFGYTVIEAFSVKTPVIGSDTGGIAKIIENKKSGLLFPVGDHKALATKMSYLLKNKDLRNKYAEGAYLRFKETYTLEKNMKIVVDMLLSKTNYSGLNYLDN